MCNARAHYIIESKVQWKPFWLATQQYPETWLAGWQVPVYYDVCARPPSLWFVAIVRLSYFTKKRLRLCQVEEDDQTNVLQGKLRLQLLGLLPWWQTEHAFGMAHLSELMHCFARMYIPVLSNSASRSGPRLPDAPCAVLLPQGRRLVFSPTGIRATKKRKKQEKEEGKTFRSERTVNFRPKSQRFLNQKVFVYFLSSAPFLSRLRRWRAKRPQAGLCLVFVPWQAQPAPGDTATTPRRFLL